MNLLQWFECRLDLFSYLPTSTAVSSAALPTSQEKGILAFAASTASTAPGQKYAWNRTWKSSGRQLKEMVVVGIAVDIEARFSRAPVRKPFGRRMISLGHLGLSMAGVRTLKTLCV